MFNAKPASLRRKSFGGQTGIGIWWRKSASPTSILSEEDDKIGVEIRNRDLSSDASIASVSSITEEPLTKKKGESASKKALSPGIRNADELPMIGWDDDLCRPIYHRSENHNDTIALVDSFDDELVRAVSSSDTGLAEASETDGSTEVIDEETPDNAGDSLEAPGNDEDEIAAGVPFRIPVLPRKRNRTFGNRAKRQRPLSLILTHDDEETPLNHDRDARRVSLESSTVTAQTEEEVISNNQTEERPKKGRRSQKPRSNDPSNSLEKAREYFANLDQTQPLTLDATLSPAVSSRVTRTRRKTNLTSPGITREYKAYAESIAGDASSGISPLSMKDYVSSRKLHFESKGELADGFLDD